MCQNTTFRVILSVPYEQVANGGIKGNIICRIDIQRQGDDFVATIIMAYRYFVNTSIVECGVLKIIRKFCLTNVNGL